MRIIAHGVGNRPTNFDFSTTFLSRLIGQQLLDGARDLATLTFDLGSYGVAVDMSLRTSSAYKVSSLYVFPFRRYDALPVSALVDLVTLTFDILTLKLAFFIARAVDNLSTNVGVSLTFRSRVIGQQLSEGPRDLATSTFDLGGHGALVDGTDLRTPSVHQVSRS